MSDERRESRRLRSIQLVEDRWANVRHVVEAAAIVAAGLWAFYIFVYQEKIKPAGDPAALTPTIAIHRLGSDATRDILEVDSTFHNTGKTEIDIAADGYDLWGVRYESKPRLRSSTTAESAEVDNDIPIRSRTLIRGSMELRAAATSGDPKRHIIIEPDATEQLPETVVVPRGSYDAIQGFIIAVPVKTSSSEKVHVSIVRDDRHGLWLHGTDYTEDDNVSNFALIQ